MYDISDQKSFDNLEKWMKVVKQLASGIPLLLIGNKIDLVDERKVSKEKGESFAEQENIIFFESSGKSGENVDESFLCLGEEIMRLNKNEDKQNTGNEYIISKDTTYNNKKKKRCC
jgi:Ras-related protein Rab-5C